MVIAYHYKQNLTAQWMKGDDPGGSCDVAHLLDAMYIKPTRYEAYKPSSPSLVPIKNIVFHIPVLHEMLKLFD